MVAQEHHVAHPKPSQYVKIAILLAMLTAIEVGLFYINNTLSLGWVNTAMLLILAALKFVIVIGWYMHLRFERITLSRFFGFGFALALSLYAIVLVSFGVLALNR